MDINLCPFCMFYALLWLFFCCFVFRNQKKTVRLKKNSWLLCTSTLHRSVPHRFLLRKTNTQVYKVSKTLPFSTPKCMKRQNLDFTISLYVKCYICKLLHKGVSLQMCWFKVLFKSRCALERGRLGMTCKKTVRSWHANLKAEKNSQTSGHDILLVEKNS